MNTSIDDHYLSSLNIFWATSIFGVALFLYHFYGEWLENSIKEQFKKQNIKFVRWGNLFFDALRGTRMDKKIQNFVDQNGKVFGFHVYGSKSIAISDPELVQQVLTKNFSNFINRRKMDSLGQIFRDMLFMAEGENWKRFRTIMTPTFAHGKIKLMKEVVDHTSELLIKNMKNSMKHSSDGIVEMRHVVGAFTMDTIVQIAFGMEIDSLIDYDNPVLVNAKALLSRDLSWKDTCIYTTALLMPKLSRMLNLQPMGKELEFFNKFSRKIVEEKRILYNRSQRTGEKLKPRNFIELLIEAEGECNKINQKEGKALKFMTTEEIVAQCVLFFTVGFDTTASAICMTCYELAQDIAYQELIYQEIQDTYKNRITETGNLNLSFEEAFTVEVLGKMTYLNAALSESLRLHSPVIFVERTAQNDITLKSEKYEIQVKKGDVVVVLIRSMHFDENIHPQPTKFNPYRFINKKFHEYSYIPFGSGPRVCIGKPLAYVEARIALVKLIKNFKFSVSSKTSIPMKYFHQGDLMFNQDVHLHVQARK